MPLSDRIRPGIEAADWVIEEVKLLESFYALAIKERDYERATNDRLRSEVANLRAEVLQYVGNPDARDQTRGSSQLSKR